MKYEHATIIVPVAHIEMIRTIARRLYRGDLTGLFATELSATGDLPATHYASTGAYPFPFLVQIATGGALRGAAQQAWAQGGHGAFPMSVAQVTAMIATFTIVKTAKVNRPPDERGRVIAVEQPLETFDATLTRVGLKLVETEETPL